MKFSDQLEPSHVLCEYLLEVQCRLATHAARQTEQSTGLQHLNRVLGGVFLKNVGLGFLPKINSN